MECKHCQFTMEAVNGSDISSKNRNMILVLNPLINNQAADLYMEALVASFNPRVGLPPVSPIVFWQQQV